MKRLRRFRSNARISCEIEVLPFEATHFKRDGLNANSRVNPNVRRKMKLNPARSVAEETDARRWPSAESSLSEMGV